MDDQGRFQLQAKVQPNTSRDHHISVLNTNSHTRGTSNSQNSRFPLNQIQQAESKFAQARNEVTQPNFI